MVLVMFIWLYQKVLSGCFLIEMVSLPFRFWGAVLINDLHADMAREFCKELNANEKRIRYSVGFEPAIAKTGFSITCDFEDDVDEEDAEYYILSYAKTYLDPKKRNLKHYGKARFPRKGNNF